MPSCSYMPIWPEQMFLSTLTSPVHLGLLQCFPQPSIADHFTCLAIELQTPGKPAVLSVFPLPPDLTAF